MHDFVPTAFDVFLLPLEQHRLTCQASLQSVLGMALARHSKVPHTLREGGAVHVEPADDVGLDGVGEAAALLAREPGEAVEA